MSSFGKTKQKTMKTLTIFSAFVAFGCAALFSCQDASNEDSVSMGENFEDSTSYEIPTDSALNYINSYIAYIDSLNVYLGNKEPVIFPNSGQRLVYGGATALSELQEILNHAQSKIDRQNADSSSFHIMLGLTPRRGGDSTHVIFCLEMFNLDGGRQSSLGNTFYDFVRPCPTSCPSWVR